ncbi:MAG: class I SAM-dependent methyltransferase, partial [Candidatus Helarchaeota archaeon]
KLLNIKKGSIILDYGCGPGSFSIAAAQLVGNTGKVYALDILPIAIEYVKKKAERKKLTNIETIISNCDTGLNDGSVDIIFLFDILHDLKDPNKIITELFRILKVNGILSISDHHLNQEKIDLIINSNLFKFKNKINGLINYIKI